MAEPRETDGALLARLGTDGRAWAEEFGKTAIHVAARLEHEEGGDGSPASAWERLARLIADDAPGGWLHGWFANAIEAGRSAGAARVEEAEAQLNEAHVENGRLLLERVPVGEWTAAVKRAERAEAQRDEYASRLRHVAVIAKNDDDATWIDLAEWVASLRARADERDALVAQRDEARTQRDAARAECDSVRQRLDNVALQRDDARAQLDAHRATLAKVRERRRALFDDKHTMRRERDAALAQLAALGEPTMERRRNRVGELRKDNGELDWNGMTARRAEFYRDEQRTVYRGPWVPVGGAEPQEATGSGSETPS